MNYGSKVLIETGIALGLFFKGNRQGYKSASVSRRPLLLKEKSLTITN